MSFSWTKIYQDNMKFDNYLEKYALSICSKNEGALLFAFFKRIIDIRRDWLMVSDMIRVCIEPDC